MRERDGSILADVISRKAEEEPDFAVVTFEHLSLDDGATSDEVRTYADLATNANRLAAGLIARGMEPGDRFALMARNHPEFVEAMIAASISGTVFVPVDPRTKGDKLVFLLNDSGCRGIICGDYCWDEVAAARGQSGGVEWILTLDSGEVAAPNFGAVAGAGPLEEVLAAPAETVDVRLQSASDPLQILYTSGTTGDPKGVVGSNERFMMGAMVGVLVGYQPDESPYTGLSLTHANAQAVTLAPSLVMGLHCVFSRRFTKSKLWDVCRAHGCTTFSLLGGMATAIYSEAVSPGDGENPVRFVLSAGMPAAIWEDFERRFGVDIYEWYGAVEGGVAFKPIGEGPVGSFGQAMPGTEMKILDEGDDECPVGVVGEICSRPEGGGTPEVEYFGNPEASAAKTRGGWLRSGDMGHSDADGWFFFDYRKGGAIRRNGDFVNVGFVEKVVAEHPHVTDVFVYGVPAASGAPGEKDVVATVVASKGISFDAASVFAHCRAGLESNFVPSYLHVVDEIPKTASEKPQERFLLEAFDPEADFVIVES